MDCSTKTKGRRTITYFHIVELSAEATIPGNADAAGTPKAIGNAPIPAADSTVAVGGHAVPT